jgi:hypothetical protein
MGQHKQHAMRTLAASYEFDMTSQQAEAASSVKALGVPAGDKRKPR